MRNSWLFALYVLSARSLATPLQPHWGDMREKHAWKAVPSNWEHVGYPASETLIDLYIALKPERENALIDALYEVSDPDHQKYGAHMSKEQVAELVAPHPNTLELINSWFKHHGVPLSSVSTSHGGGWLTVTGVPVSRANALLGTSYQHYQHAETKDRVLRALSYALPEVLHKHVKTVAPTTYFGSPQQQTSRKRSGGETAAGGLVKVLSKRVNINVDPAYLRWRYGMQSYVPAATERNVLGIVGLYGEYPSQEDLGFFMEEYRADAVDATFTLRQVGTGNLPNRPSSESNLEIQYTESITFPTRHEYYTTVSPMRVLTWLDAILDDEAAVPQTISISYSDDEQDIPRDYAEEVCSLFAELGLRGASVLVASGDDAVGAGNCRANDGSGRIQYQPKFPASCPWVTSVGGTKIVINGTPIGDLVPYERGDESGVKYSSGGFSNYFSRPPYQEDAVSVFLRDFEDRPNPLYNSMGRGFPDVAALTEFYGYIIGGEIERQFGTGCSTPTVAAVVSLLNDYLISNHNRPLGWLNPWLYRHGKGGFTDVTRGRNPACGEYGFPAIPGWDPITGFGSPNFRVLLTIAESTAVRDDSYP